MTTPSSDSQVGWPGNTVFVGSAECLVASSGSPQTLARNAHDAEVEPVDGEVAEGDGAAAGGDSARGH